MSLATRLRVLEQWAASEEAARPYGHLTDSDLDAHIADELARVSGVTLEDMPTEGHERLACVLDRLSVPRIIDCGTPDRPEPTEVSLAYRLAAVFDMTSLELRDYLKESARAAAQ